METDPLHPVQSSSEDRRLARLTEIALGLPEATRKDNGGHAAFQVRSKTFTYFLSDHHGDGSVGACCKMALGETLERTAADPARFYLPAYIGPKGWVGLRLDSGEVDWDE